MKYAAFEPWTRRQTRKRTRPGQKSGCCALSPGAAGAVDRFAMLLAKTLVCALHVGDLPAVMAERRGAFLA